MAGAAKQQSLERRQRTLVLRVLPQASFALRLAVGKGQKIKPLSLLACFLLFTYSTNTHFLSANNLQGTVRDTAVGSHEDYTSVKW